MYKYLPPERIDVLTSKMICFSNPKNFNDPFEFHALYDFDLFMRDIKKNLIDADVIFSLSPEGLKLFFELILSRSD